MRVMVIVKASPSSEAGQMPSTELLQAMGAFNQRLAEAGVMVDGAGLKPSSQGARVQFSGTNRLVVDGPFAETKELVAGFWIWQVNSLQEAIEWVKQCPNPMPEDSEIEIRPFYENADFEEQMTPDLKEQFAATLATSLGLLPPTFQDRPQTIFVGFQQRYTAETRQHIPDLWNKFVPQIPNLAHNSSSDCFGVCFNGSADCSFDYMAAIAVTHADNLPPGMTSLTVAAQRYVVFTHQGHVSKIADTLEMIWTRWLPESGLQAVPGAACIERYTPEFNPQTGMGGMEIWLALA